jgi:hypothetical protein
VNLNLLGILWTSAYRTLPGWSDLRLFIEENHMFRVQAPVIAIPTAEVRQAIGKNLRAVMIDAYRAIAQNGEGLEIAHLQVRFRDRLLAVCYCIRLDGFIEIELGLGNPKLTSRTITLRQLREAETHVHKNNQPVSHRR